MQKSKKTKPTDLDETIQDFEFARKKLQLTHQIEVKARAVGDAPYLEQIRLQKEIAALDEQLKKLDQEKIDALENPED